MKLATGISLAICGFEILFLGGVLFAWNPVLYTFIEDGIFADKCYHDNVTKDNETTVVEDCSERDSLFNLCYIIGSVSVGVSSFPFGVFFDRFGLRVGRIVASIFSLLGMLSWGFANKENPFLIFVGSILLGCAASFICTTNMHAAQLAGKRTGIFLSLFVAVYEITGLSFSVVLILHQLGFHRKWSLIVVSLLIIPSTWNTFCLLPKFKIDMSDPKEESKSTISTVEKEIPDNKVDEKTKKDQTKPRVWHYIFSLVYILHLTWFCMMNISINTFYGTMVPWLTNIYPNDTHKVSTMVEMFGFLSTVCLIVSPLFGHLMDFFRNRYTVKGNSNLWLKAKPALYPTLIVGVGEIAFNVVHLGRTEWTIYSLFVLNFIVTPAVYTCVVAFIPVVFPLEHYGKLLGLQFFFVSVIQFAQVPLLKWAQSTSFNRMRLFLLGLSVLCLLQPLSIMYKSRRVKIIQSTTEKRDTDEQKSFIT